MKLKMLSNSRKSNVKKKMKTLRNHHKTNLKKNHSNNKILQNLNKKSPNKK